MPIIGKKRNDDGGKIYCSQFAIWCVPQRTSQHKFHLVRSSTCGTIEHIRLHWKETSPWQTFVIYFLVLTRCQATSNGNSWPMCFTITVDHMLATTRERRQHRFCNVSSKKTVGFTFAFRKSGPENGPVFEPVWRDPFWTHWDRTADWFESQSIPIYWIKWSVL